MKNNETFNNTNMMNETPSIAQMKNDLFKSFDIVRDVISHEEYWSILFLLLAYKDNVAFKYLNIQSNLLTNSSNQDNDLIDRYDQVFEVVEPIINRIGEQRLVRLIEVFHSFDAAFLNDNFSQLFEVLLQEINLYQGKFSDTVSQPKELTEFMCQLVQFENAKSIYNPFSGYASFGLSLNDGQQFFGQEINRKTWAVGQLHLLANKIGSNVQIKCEDVIDNFPNQDQQFDLIISHPPFNSLRDRNIRGRWINKYVSAEQFLVENGINLLTATGKMILVVPSSFLYLKGGSEHIIQNLVGKDLIDIIVSLPGGMLSGTSVPISVVLLNKKKKTSSKIKLIDAKNFVVKKVIRGESNLDIQNLLHEIKLDKNSESIRIISNQDVVVNDYNLNTGRYFIKDISISDNEYLVKLGDIIEIVRGQRVNLHGKGKVLKISDLKDDHIDFTLDINKVEESDFRGSEIQLISESCLLFAMKFKKIKPTIFIFNGEPIYKNQNISSFKIKESKINAIDIAYLINELHSDYVQNQVDKFINGSAIPFIRREDLLEILIKIPLTENQKSIELQRSKVEGVKQSFIRAKEQELKLQKEILGIKEDRFKEFASIKHTFRQYLGALKSNVTGTRKFLNRKDGQIISLEDIYSTKLNQSFRDHLLSIEETIRSLSMLLENETFISNESNLEKLNLLDLVKESHMRFAQNNFKFELYFDEVSFIDNDLTLDPIIEIDKEDFFKLFLNIVSNAINHGFKTIDGNIILSKIIYESNTENFILEISNNGVPMPENFTLNHLTTRGEKTTDSKGTGIGGADIKDIVKKYNGSLDLIHEKDAIFPVTYRISFPINKNNIEYEI